MLRYYIGSCVLPVFYVVIFVINSEAVPVDLEDVGDFGTFKHGQNENADLKVLEVNDDKTDTRDVGTQTDQSDCQQELDPVLARQILRPFSSDPEGPPVNILLIYVEKIEQHFKNDRLVSDNCKDINWDYRRFSREFTNEKGEEGGCGEGEWEEKNDWTKEDGEGEVDKDDESGRGKMMFWGENVQEKGNKENENVEKVKEGLFKILQNLNQQVGNNN